MPEVPRGMRERGKQQRNDDTTDLELPMDSEIISRNGQEYAENDVGIRFLALSVESVWLFSSTSTPL